MKNNLRHKALKGAFWVGAQNLGAQASSFVVFVVLARLLEPVDFGLVAMAAAFISFLQLFTAQALSSAIVQRDQLEPEHLDTAFWLNIALGVLVGGAAVLLSGYVAALYGQPDVQAIIVWLSFGLFCGTFNIVQLSLLRRNLQFRTIALRTLVGEPVAGVVALIMAYTGFGVWSLVAREIVSTLMQVFIVWRKSDWRPSLRFSRRHLSDLLGFGLSMMGAGLLSFGNKRLHHFLIGYAFGPAGLGYYSIAKRLVTLLTEFIGGTVNKVAWPVFARVQDDKLKSRSAFYEATQMVALVLFPTFLGVAALAPELIPVLFGDKWEGSIVLMQVLSLLGILRSTQGLQESVIVATGKSGWRLGLQGILTISSVIGFLVTVQWGLLPVVISYVAVSFVLAPLWTWCVWKVIQIDLRTYLNIYVAPIVVSLTMLCVLAGAQSGLGTRLSPSLTLAVLIGIGALTYALALRIFYPARFMQMHGILEGVVFSGRAKKKR